MVVGGGVFLSFFNVFSYTMIQQQISSLKCNVQCMTLISSGRESWCTASSVCVCCHSVVFPQPPSFLSTAVCPPSLIWHVLAFRKPYCRKKASGLPYQSEDCGMGWEAQLSLPRILQSAARSKAQPLQYRSHRSFLTNDWSSATPRPHATVPCWKL